MERDGIYTGDLPLRVDVMWTCRFADCMGLSKLMVVVFVVYICAVASSKDGGIDRSEAGFLTMNSIPFLMSALKENVGNTIVH